MLRKTVLGITVLAFATAGVGLNSVDAAGQVERGNGRSICRFSGLNDDPNEAFPEDGRVQSFGQLVSKLGPMGGVPGLECNPNTGPDLHPHPKN